MALKTYGSHNPSLRLAATLDYSDLTARRMGKKLTWILPKQSGRNATGVVTTRHQGSRQKRYYRDIDWKREKMDMPGTVLSLEYDPNRTAHIALVQYGDGEKRYILAPEGLAVGMTVMSGDAAPLTVGNSLRLSQIPVGTLIHNLELLAGKGAQLVRGAGTAATLMGFEEAYALVKLPSGEIRRFPPTCRATLGQVSAVDWKNVNLGKAGRARRYGVRPTVRGTAQNPRSHPHGGGEGRTGEGMHPKTPWGKSARGTRTRSRRKRSSQFIVKRRTS